MSATTSKSCNDDGGQGIGAGHVCMCARKRGHALDTARPHACPCGALWASVEEPGHE